MSQDLIRAVVEARVLAARLQEIKATRHQAWLEENAGLLSQIEDAQYGLINTETALRDAALGEYEESKAPDGTGGNKHPIPGTEIKVGVVPVYEAEPALAWALEHKQAVRPASLNAKEFEAIVKVMAEKPDFVVMKEEAKATLASDMAAALEGIE